MAVVSRSGVDPKAINYVTVGNTIPTESRFAYVARVASLQAGLPASERQQKAVAALSYHQQGRTTKDKA